MWDLDLHPYDFNEKDYIYVDAGWEGDVYSNLKGDRYYKVIIKEHPLKETSIRYHCMQKADDTYTLKIYNIYEGVYEKHCKDLYYIIVEMEPLICDKPISLTFIDIMSDTLELRKEERDDEGYNSRSLVEEILIESKEREYQLTITDFQHLFFFIQHENLLPNYCEDLAEHNVGFRKDNTLIFFDPA